MSDKLTIMLSSTISDMPADRDAIVKLFDKYPFINILGANPIQKSYASNPYLATLKMAEECDFYILLLGSRYGYEIRNDTSATEAEFDKAYATDPTKILVFKNISEQFEPKQQKFIEKVGDYYKGFWITDYKYSHELQDIVEESFLDLLKDRASIGKKLSYIDRFTMLAIQRKPTQDTLLSYSIDQHRVELTYILNNEKKIIQFMRKRVNSDFWGCISELENKFAEWMK